MFTFPSTFDESYKMVSELVISWSSLYSLDLKFDLEFDPSLNFLSSVYLLAFEFNSSSENSIESSDAIEHSEVSLLTELGFELIGLVLGRSCCCLDPSL